MINTAKFFRKVKETISDTKETLEKELKVEDLKRDVADYKLKFEENIDSIKNEVNIYDPKEPKNLFTDVVDMNKQESIKLSK
jgi:hypothetical protein